ncbi:hemerythrin domain-containing protein [Flavitalea sp. BT771]|uniref:hemerythrin domain-containing protein n=1 Tax=Flavitalea sp. BT771 TaxID=3063329 RepID=UPI0026E2A201|nr:hemerythrin domain-containing protein [Flavitalea sp. BT771]MDO6429528.1 hemerythrin domain-containing protein [Flavitalea sp. BT771]MDV6218344.1 hemerythrin domain-containing protein [Flavitalea sp. BT771]
MHTDNSRRRFLGQSLKAGLLGSASGILLLHGCKEKEEDKEVSPPEDLMQEHGLLNRILLIYDHCREQLAAKQTPPLDALSGAAGIIKTFVEDYHEKQEEDYLFPRFRKAGVLTDLVNVLLQQHNAGRAITQQLMELGKVKAPTDDQRQQLILLLTRFNTMYRPHEAREDTVLFPAFRRLVTRHEYDSLGEEFENNEHKRFGKDGFEVMVDKVMAIEKQLGIYELAQFTPGV